MLYMVTFTIHIPQMLAYIPYMDPMGYCIPHVDAGIRFCSTIRWFLAEASKASPSDIPKAVPEIPWL